MRRILLGVAMAAAACAPAAQRSGRPVAVTTVAPITNIVRNVAGDHAEVRGVIPEGTDSHTFEPSPHVARMLAAADVVFLNGLHLEEPTRKLARANVRRGVRIVLLGERTITRDQWVFDFSFPRSKGDPNPHLWMNPLYAARYAEIAADELARIDRANAAAYRANARRFRERCAELDRRIAQASATIPPPRRKLLTYHDSFAYFAPRYGYQVIGAVQPSDFSEPSPQEVARLIDQIRREGVPAVFGSEVFPSTVLDQIARETGIRYVTELRDDALPDPPANTYLGMMVEDVRKIVEALGGDPKALDGFDVSNVS